MQWLKGKIRLQNHKHSHLEKEAKNKNPFCSTVHWLPEQRINCIPQDQDCKVKSITYFVSIHWYYGGWVGSLFNQLFLHNMMQVSIFSLCATLHDSAHQFHLLSVALLIVAFSVDTISLLVKILGLQVKAYTQNLMT